MNEDWTAGPKLARRGLISEIFPLIIFDAWSVEALQSPVHNQIWGQVGSLIIITIKERG
jgi:hypothetical protein